MTLNLYEIIKRNLLDEIDLMIKEKDKKLKLKEFIYTKTDTEIFQIIYIYKEFSLQKIQREVY